MAASTVSTEEVETPFCCHCKEDFPVGPRFAMGVLVPLDKAPARLRDRFYSWREHPSGAYLCGNCYFDLTDEW
jgi:hypothetical protein